MEKTFTRHERLKSEKIISGLFKTGHSFSAYPLRLVYSELPTTEFFQFFPAYQFSFSVSKRNFKRAVDRNLMRRRMREACRLHKILLHDFLRQNPAFAHKKFAFMVLYTAKEQLSYAEIEKGALKMMYKFQKEIAHRPA